MSNLDFSWKETVQTIGSIQFNQDNSRFIITSNNKFCVFSVEEQKKLFEGDCENSNAVEMVYNTNLVAIGEKTKVKIYDSRKGEIVLELEGGEESSDIVSGIKFTSHYVVVICKKKAYVYDRNNTKDKYWILQSYDNSDGISSSSEKNDVFALPSPKCGNIYICSLKDRRNILVEGHQYPIQCLSFNCEGTVLASCSNNARNIKIFKASNGVLIRTVRRGRSSQTMYSLSFSKCSKFLCCYSSSGTIHQFSVNNENQNKSTVLKNYSYIPGFSIFGSEWSMNLVTLPDNDFGKCVFSGKDPNICYLVTKKGKFCEIDFSKKEEERLRTKNLIRTNSGRNLKKEEFEEERNPKKEKKNSLEDDKIAIFMDCAKSCNLGELKKKKFLVPVNIKYELFVKNLGRKLKKDSNLQFKLFVGEEEEVLTVENWNLKEIYLKHKNEYGILVMKYGQ